MIFTPDLRAGVSVGQWAAVASFAGCYSSTYSPADDAVAFLSGEPALPLYHPLPRAPCKKRWGVMSHFYSLVHKCPHKTIMHILHKLLKQHRGTFPLQSPYRLEAEYLTQGCSSSISGCGDLSGGEPFFFFIELLLITSNNKEIQQRKSVWQSQNVQYKY